MAITDFLFPQGNFLNIRANAPNQRAYNIDATADLVKNNPLSILGEIYAPALTAATSIPYDTIQGIGRAVDQSNVGTGPYRGIVDDTEIPRGPSLSDIGQAIDAENPLSSAIERTIGAATPLAERISNISNPFRMSQAAASEVDLSNRNINTTPYQDRIMGGVQGDPNPFGYQNQINDFVIDNENYKEIPGFNFKDAPTSLKSRLTNREFLNNPRTGFIDNTLMQTGNPGNSIIDKAKSGISKGFNLGKTAIGGLASLVSGIPGLGLLANAFGPMSPEDKAMRDFYGSQFGLTDTGQVASGIMKGYNPVSLFGSTGLNQAIDKRIARIQKTLKKRKSETLKNRLKELQALKAKESAASSAALEAQRRGRRPSAPSGDGGTKDSGGPTGGYSYDAGGREGFGYGLKNGGLAGLL